MGRKKISRIENDRTRSITFNKRKSGLIKKAMELSILCDCEISVVIFNKENERMTNLFEYSSSDPRVILQKYCTVAALPHERYANKDYELFCRKKKGGGGKASSTAKSEPKKRMTRSRRREKKGEKKGGEGGKGEKKLEITLKDDKPAPVNRANPADLQASQYQFAPPPQMGQRVTPGDLSGIPSNYYYPRPNQPQNMMNFPQDQSQSQTPPIMMPAKKRMLGYYQQLMNPFQQNTPQSVDSVGSSGSAKVRGNPQIIPPPQQQSSPPLSDGSNSKSNDSKVLPSISNALGSDDSGQNKIHPLQSTPLNMKPSGTGLGTFSSMNPTFSPMMLPTTPKTFDLETPGMIGSDFPTGGNNTFGIQTPKSGEK